MELHKGEGGCEKTRFFATPVSGVRGDVRGDVCLFVVSCGTHKNSPLLTCTTVHGLIK